MKLGLLFTLVEAVQGQMVLSQVQLGNSTSTGAVSSAFVSAPPPTAGAAIAQAAFTPQERPATPQPTFSGNGFANQVLASPHNSAAASAALATLKAGLASTQFSGGTTPTVSPTVAAARADNATSAGFAGQVFSGGTTAD